MEILGTVLVGLVILIGLGGALTQVYPGPLLVLGAVAVWAVAEGSTAYGVANAIAASAEGYAFPTNLDRDQPIDGMAPATMAQIVARALADGAAASVLDQALTRWEQGRVTH